MRIRVEMDRVSMWYPVAESTMLSGEKLEEQLSELDPVYRKYAEQKNTPTFDIPDAFVRRYNRLQQEMLEMQEVLEQLYRSQQGLKLHPTPKINIEQYQIKDRT